LKHVGLDYFGGEPDVKLEETIQSAMILLFTLFRVDILIPHLANDSCSRLLFRKTLTSCSCCSIGATPLMGHETTKHSGLRALSLDMLANDDKMEDRGILDLPSWLKHHHRHCLLAFQLIRILQ